MYLNKKGTNKNKITAGQVHMTADYRANGLSNLQTAWECVADELGSSIGKSNAVGEVVRMERLLGLLEPRHVLEDGQIQLLVETPFAVPVAQLVQ